MAVTPISRAAVMEDWRAQPMGHHGQQSELETAHSGAVLLQDLLMETPLSLLSAIRAESAVQQMTAHHGLPLVKNLLTPALILMASHSAAIPLLQSQTAE
jgi:alpha-D-ribose 1-methylphosphonate 5-triphosphate synthase subunit PhnH